jgi:hypothetical protein
VSEQCSEYESLSLSSFAGFLEFEDVAFEEMVFQGIVEFEGAALSSPRHPSHVPILPRRDGKVAEGHFSGPNVVRKSA